MEQKSCDVIVVGAGLVGICCALSIVEAGLSVKLIDRDEPGQGASFGNAGIISPWSVVPQSMPGLWKQIPSMVFGADGPLSVRLTHLPKLVPWGLRFLRNGNREQVVKAADAMELLNQSNIEMYRRHLSGTGHEHLVRDSMYVHAFRDARKASLDALGYAIRREKGAVLEKIDRAELRDLEPALSVEFEAAILIKGQARAMAPGKIADVLAQKAKRLGVEIVKANVEAIHPGENGGWTAETDSGNHGAERVVLAAGAWSARLLKPLGVDLPLEAERGYHVEYADPGVSLNNSVMDVDNMFVASSMDDGLRVAGTAEFAGLDAPPNPKRIASLGRLAKKMLPMLDDRVVKTWMGVRPSMPDSLPVLGELSPHKGLIAAFGHAHYGLMMAPKTGKIIADLVAEKPTNLDLSPFSPDRF